MQTYNCRIFTQNDFILVSGFDIGFDESIYSGKVVFKVSSPHEPAKRLRDLHSNANPQHVMSRCVVKGSKLMPCGASQSVNQSSISAISSTWQSTHALEPLVPLNLEEFLHHYISAL